MNGPVSMLKGVGGITPAQLAVGVPGRVIRVASVPVPPPTGGVPRIPLSAHSVGCLGSDAVRKLGNCTPESLAPSSWYEPSCVTAALVEDVAFCGYMPAV